jgi:hypothetical protein
MESWAGGGDSCSGTCPTEFEGGATAGVEAEDGMEGGVGGAVDGAGLRRGRLRPKIQGGMTVEQFCDG